MIAQVREFSNGCIVVLPDEATANIYGRMKTELAAAGKLIPENDIWIAATAKEHGLPLVTRDQHFLFVSGLTIFKW
jgi:tRNA(fMet)-specific endonuclease VapC